MAPIRSPEATRWRQAAGLALVAVVLGTGLLTADRLTRPGSAVEQGGVVMTADTSAATASATPGPVSIGFAQEMSQHHEQALLLARFAEVHGSAVVQAWQGQGVTPWTTAMTKTLAGTTWLTSILGVKVN